MSTTFRADRAGEAIRMSVSRTLRQDISDPRLEAVTITGCEVTRDLGFARVFYTVLGDDEARLEAQSGFDSAAPFLRSRVAEEVPLRIVPELSFRYDTSTDNALRLEQIFATLPELQSDTPPVAPSKPIPAPVKPRKRR